MNDPLPQTRARPSAASGLARILTGSTLAQLMAVIATPLLARLFDPQETADFAYLVGVGTVIAAFASLKLDLAIPLPEQDQDGRELFWLATITPIPILGILSAMMLALAAFDLFPLRSIGFTDGILIAGFVVAVNCRSAATQYAVRAKAYPLIGRASVAQMAGTICAQVALGFARISSGLFGGTIAGRSVGALLLVSASSLNWGQRPCISSAKKLLRRYKSFAIVLAPAAVVNVLGANIAAIMLPAHFGLAAAGLYAMAFRISAMPATIIAEATGQVFLGEFTRVESPSDAKAIFLRYSAGLATGGIFVAAAIWFVAPLVLGQVLGTEWSGTANLARWTGVVAGAAIFGSPLQHVWTVRQRVWSQLGWNIARLTVVGGTIIVSSQVGSSINQAAAHVALASATVYIAGWVLCFFAASGAEMS